MDIILATRNPSKVKQIKQIFDGSRFIIRTLEDAGIKGEAIEDGETLEENALKKARYAYEACGKKYWTMADDTGLFIEALGGEPGVHSAYWGGHHLTKAEILEYCLKRMNGVTNRRATFRTVVALISPEGKEKIIEAEACGTLLEAPRVAFQPGMPYSALFVSDGETKSLAEMTVEEENTISHRGKAFREVRACLEKQT